MRALLLALIILPLGCGSKKDGTSDEAAKPSAEPAAMNVREGSSAAPVAGSGSGSTADKPTEAAAAPPPGYTGGSGAQDKATEVEQARAVAKTEADTAKESADATATKAHKLVQDKVQTDFDASDRKFAALKEKAALATGAKKTKADAAIADITKREATVMAGIAKLRDATVAQWDSTKTQLDTDTVAFNKAIGALDVTLR